MADIKIDRGVFSTPLEFGDLPENLGIAEELTSLPEWRGWDRIENSSLSEAPLAFGLDMNSDVGPIMEQLRLEPEYSNLVDLDEKRLLLDVMNNISNKLDAVVEKTNSPRLANFQETLNDLLDMYQTAYYQQLASIKG